MFKSGLPDPDLLKTVLEPLLNDFQDWFSRSQTLLETEEIPFLEAAAQAELLDRVKQAQREVSTAKSLFLVTEGTVGVEMAVLVPWHQLLMECWRVSSRLRTERAANFSAGA
ncbi:DUF2605 domain-containing protein [Trichothermofontia sp.]